MKSEQVKQVLLSIFQPTGFRSPGLKPGDVIKIVKDEFTPRRVEKEQYEESKAGVHPKIVQERLGHSSITLTMDTYSHVVPSMQEAAVKKLKDTLKEEQWRQNGDISQ